MNPAYPPFSVSQFTTYPLTFEEDVKLYAALGVEGIEICEEKLSPDPRRARGQLAMVRERGLRVTSVQPRVHSPFPHDSTVDSDPKTPETRMARFRQTIDLFADCFPGEDIIMVAGGGIAPDYNFRLAHRIAREVFPELAEYAAGRGIRIGFEHLNPILMNAYTFVTTLDEAVALVDAVDHPNFGLFLDLWHIWREPNICERLETLSAPILGMHISDWPRDEPRHLSDRILPGNGVIALPALLRATHNSGYRGAYCLEVYSAEHLPDSLWCADPAEVIRQGRDGFRHAWDAGMFQGGGAS